MHPRFALPLISVAFLASASAAPPAWWAQRGATNTEPSVDNAAVTQGQLKHFTRKAVEELNSAVPGGAGEELNALIQTWIAGHPDPDDNKAMALGQLKWIANKIHARLIYLRWEDAKPAWITPVPATDSLLANLGQLKTVFNFDLSVPTGQLPEWWQKFYFNDVTVDPAANPDGDWLTNLEEFQLGTHPLEEDSDDDGFSDGFLDSDGDGLADQWEQLLIEQKADPSAWNLVLITAAGDEDGDGVSNLQEHQLGLNGYQQDSDGDGYDDNLSVAEEVFLRLDEATGVVAVDSSDKGRNGSLASGASWQATSGIEDGALQFSGGTETLNLSGDVLNGATNVTISLWFKTSQATAGQAFLSSAGPSQSPALALALENGNTVRFHAGGGDSVTWTYGRSLADDLWHHLVVTRDAAASRVTLLVDGEQFGEIHNISLAPLAVDTVALGQLHNTTTSFEPAFAFAGLLDNVRVHSKVLDENGLPQLFRPNDLDADGLPDDWEVASAGDLANLASSGDDPDGDGLSNRHEYEAGTDPNDYYNGVTPMVTLVTGSGQTIRSGEKTKNPLVFKVTTNGTTPLVGAPLLLEHLELIGSIETVDGDTLATTLSLRTGDGGLVKVHFKAD